MMNNLYFTYLDFPEIRGVPFLSYTSLKFNGSPLKNGGSEDDPFLWAYGAPVTFQGKTHF